MNILQKKPRIKATLKYLVVLILVLLVTIFQDFLGSENEQFSQYYSEPLLRNLFWFLVFPVALLSGSTFKKVSLLAKISVLLIKRLLFVFLASIFHILFFAGLIHLASSVFYEQTYSFTNNLRFAISEDLYKYLLIYSVISLILIKNGKNVYSQ